MIPKEILQKVRRIEIRTRGVVNNLFGGEYHSVFKGRGMTFSEVREYQPGDDIRLIDWNVTARTGTPFVKIFEEERELTVFLLVDVSRSGHFGTIEKFKTEIGAEIGAVLGFSAIKNNDKVGVILFSDDVEQYIAPKKGKSHVLRVIRELLYHKPRGKGTSINKALDFLLKVSKRQSVVFLISDFQDDGYWKTLRIANRKHDLIGIHLFDQSEVEFPDMGLVKVHDPETEKEVWIDTRSYQERLNYNRTMKERLGKLKKESERIKFDLITVSTTEDYVEPLMSFFKQREKRF
ncbi:MAG TPA: DUF58 domain-containing protein [Candidatus Marinimicrobia bacterium]|jgi:uncharacterized protein (DUF58 family)|nr:DUF58 domain-containing protein [Candidatus Neomarinimicrobiota bacterium]MDP6261155.1 DUF58 domain-containing protein [Candidatus Neomarinimicrobiota bacterium]MDP7127261.1 DUF58 domain-containing protein [Candidatus Neomarinimicrobiota bacterium]MDP7337317.1 DUF58 domain-containing protein [Candidatus Neomarinimicrobiota bacterium]MDP7474780.1 DUF58 domain-containing protein [Candidatus Neomarinimicrobiota bacterium]|tara:strand:- start:6704 stop:7579 length:876 start_codon:yes stop_codon:yes gene_type:complete